MRIHYKNSYFSYLLMYFFSLAVFSGYISVYLMDKGYHASQVSMVVSCSFILSMIIQPIVGYFNDHYSQKRLNMLILLLAAVLGIIFIYAQNIYMIALIYSLALGLFNAANPVIENMATLSRFSYGKIRIWGTIGYAVASKISGVIYDDVSPEAMYTFFTIGLILCVIGIYGTQNVKQVKTQKKEKTTGLFQKNFIIYLVIVCLFYAITNTNTTYLPAMFQNLGLSMNTISTVIFILTLSELPIIYFSPYYMNRLSNKQLLVGIFVLLIVQFFTYSFIKQEIIVIIVSICTKAVSTMLFIMLNLKIVATIVDMKRQMNALALVQTCRNFGSIVFQFVAGYLIDFYSYDIFYLILCLLSIVGMVICIFYRIPSGNHQHLFD
ncbi:MFS transporter [Massilimicrobiota timonensis]|uniref:MFS transporter n=1 Tax=Massilimicrobiota timonensis TaxID=1776392 RepID=UPI001F5E26C6|nr:MFS transporter [Massilimicrobiota timonensis]